MIYDAADKAIREMNRANLKAFGRLKLAKWDELNVIRQVSAVYELSTALAKRKYAEVGMDAYIFALMEMGLGESVARGMAQDDITTDWVLDMLEEVDPVTLYIFLEEAERKKQRLIEALAVAHNRGAEIDNALRYWTVQVGQYADNTVYRARLDALKAVGVKRVRWVTQQDDRVCGDCDELDNKVFDVDKVPPPQHIHCRCYVIPILD